MGSNYFTRVSDALTDVFDIAQKRMEVAHPEMKSEITAYVATSRKAAYEAFITHYKQVTDYEAVLKLKFSELARKDE